MTYNQINAIAFSLELGLALPKGSVFRSEDECSIVILGLERLDEKRMEYILATAQKHGLKVDFRADITHTTKHLVVVELYLGDLLTYREPLEG